MKIALLSDTHGNKKFIEKILPRLMRADLVIHLGDHFYDMDKFIPQLGDKLVTVYGNCDGGGEDKILVKEGVKILVCHGDKYRVKLGLTRIYLKALEIGAKLVLYGHTHVAKIDYEQDVTLINPGSMTHFGRKSYCEIQIDDGVINAQIVDVDKNESV